MPTPSIFDWAGGDAAFGRLTTVFYRQVRQDPLLAPVFAGMDEQHAEHVAAWLAEVFGGPARYTQELGGHAHMATKHLGRGITEPQRRRWVTLLMDAADEACLPTDPELRCRPSSPITSSGVRGWRWSTPATTRRPCRPPTCHGGAGTRRRPGRAERTRYSAPLLVALPATLDHGRARPGS
jgi:truncated hemoglobin YjbI